MGIPQTSRQIQLADCPLQRVGRMASLFAFVLHDGRQGGSALLSQIVAELLALDIPEEVFTQYEWQHELNTYRESQIPASLLNSFGRPSVSDDERDWPAISPPDAAER